MLIKEEKIFGNYTNTWKLNQRIKKEMKSEIFLDLEIYEDGDTDIRVYISL
jgi:hypothetical protein